MNKLNFRKLLPGLVSVIIIAGMAAQSFATSVDMAAFVDKEKYMTKYYELDWRIDQIENRLINLYQFTCSNVRTFAGAGYTSSGSAEITRTGANLYSRTSILQNPYMASPLVNLRNPGYLRLNSATALSWNTGTPSQHGHNYVKSIPASLCQWMDGIEPAENCTIEVNAWLNYNNGGGVSTMNGFTNYNYVTTMGPFKKFKYPANYGSGGIWVKIPPEFGQPGVTTGNQTRSVTSNPTDLQYAENSLTKPTTWTNLSTTNSRPYVQSYLTGGLSGFPNRDYDEYPSTAFYPEKGSNTYYCYYWNGALPSTSLEGKTNVWLRFYNYSSDTADGGYVSAFNGVGINTVIKNWNNNK